MENQNLIFFVIIIIVIVLLGIIAIAVYIGKQNNGNKSGYQLLFSVNDANSFRQHFLFDNPDGTIVGSDPTNSYVNYSYGLEKTEDGTQIKPNVNGNGFWQEISDIYPNSLELIHDYPGGIEISLSENLIQPENQRAGAPRVVSRKLFKGGLFVFDVEACPYGCGLWPALWLNGFVGVEGQYHEKKGTKLYNQSMEKLLRATESSFNGTCKSTETLLETPVPDPNLSDFAGKDIYVAIWPANGEMDILENVDFSDSNLFSIHGGPKCELTIQDDTTQFLDGGNNDKPRSVCGATYWTGSDDPNNWGLGPYSGCKNTAHSAPHGNDPGGTSTTETGEVKQNCPRNAATGSGNVQIIGPQGSFGPKFNDGKGGVFANYWVPNEKVYMYFWPRTLFSESYLSQKGGPLSQKPVPEEFGKFSFSDNPDLPEGPYKIQWTSYEIGQPDALSAGCDFNFQEIVINIALMGGWAGGVLPAYCSVDNNTDPQNYVQKCYQADVLDASQNPGRFDRKTGCFDGATENYRGKDAKPVFFSQKQFQIRSIKVFQNPKTDENIW